MNYISRDVPAAPRWPVSSLILAALLVAGWAWLTYVTISAQQQMGVSAAAKIFATDMSHPWRSQFNTDLLLHSALVAAWILYRTRSLAAGLILALLTINGALFTFAYVFILTVQCKGDLNKVLLGWRSDVAIPQIKA